MSNNEKGQSKTSLQNSKKSNVSISSKKSKEYSNDTNKKKTKNKTPSRSYARPTIKGSKLAPKRDPSSLMQALKSKVTKSSSQIKSKNKPKSSLQSREKSKLTPESVEKSKPLVKDLDKTRKDLLQEREQRENEREKTKPVSQNNLANKNEMDVMINYLRSMTYNMPEVPPKTEFRIELLATPTAQYIRDLRLYKHNFYPREKLQRIKGLIRNATAKTTESLEKIFQNRNKKQETAKQRKMLREKKYLQTFKGIQNNYKTEIMDEIIDRFVNYTAYKSIQYEKPKILTTSLQKLSLTLKKYIFLIMAPKTCLLPCDDLALDTLSLILAELIFMGLYETKKIYEVKECESIFDKNKCLSWHRSAVRNFQSKRSWNATVNQTNKSMNLNCIKNC